MDELDVRMNGQRAMVIDLSCKYKSGEMVTWLKPQVGTRKKPMEVRIQDRSVDKHGLKPRYRVQKKIKYGYSLIYGWWDESEFEAVKTNAE